MWNCFIDCHPERERGTWVGGAERVRELIRAVEVARLGRVKIFYVYLLASRTRVLYVGVTNDLERRLVEHKSKEVRGFTSEYNVDRLSMWSISRMCGRRLRERSRSRDGAGGRRSR